MGRLKFIFGTLILLSVIFIAGFFIYFQHWLNHHVMNNQNEIKYYVQKNTSFSKIIYDLNKQNIIKHPKLFIYYSKLTNKDKSIKYGTYLFQNFDTPKSILNKLINGDTITIKITLPEGLNIFQIAEKFSEFFMNWNKDQWEKYLREYKITKLFGKPIPETNLEGFIYPETYFFDPHEEPEFIVKSILSEFKKNITAEMFDKAKLMGLDPVQFITLASIVERETSLDKERNLVSAVYWNRLKKRMKMQADPTVIYGVWDEYNGSLTKKQLLTPTPYNTYTFVGLPKGPISSPSLKSFNATLNPAKSNALYFVATGRGNHTFSKTLAEHNRAVHLYFRYLRESKK